MIGNGKPPSCKECVLYEKGKGFVVPRLKGDEKPKLLIQGEAPGRNELEKGQPFVGEAGHWLRNNILQAAGLNEGDYIVDNTIRCLIDGKSGVEGYPKGKDRPKAEAYCSEKHEIWANYPGVPLLLAGSKSAGTQMEDDRISRWHGHIESRGGRLVGCTYHPAAVMRNPNLLPLVRQEVRNLLRASINPKLLERPTIRKGWIKQENDDFAFDLEWGKDGRITAMGVSYACGETYSTYDVEGSRPWLISTIKGGRNCAWGHNIIGADLPILGFDPVAIRRLVDSGNIVDTMRMAFLVHAHFAELGLFGLSDMCKYYFPVGEWKEDKQDLLEYNGRDAYYNKLLYHELERDLVYTKQEHLLPKQMKLAALAVAMKQKGIKLDVPELEKYARERKATRDQIKASFSFNPNSPIQIKKWAKEQGVSLRDTEYETLQKHEWRGGDFAKLVEYKEDSKQLKTWFPLEESEGDLYCSGHHIFPDFNDTGTAVARWSSSGPNVQNISPGGDRLLPGGGIKVMPNLRRFLIARDPSLQFVSVDYSQLEDWTVAFCSGDDVLLGDLQSGKDIHRLTAAAYIKALKHIDLDPDSLDKKGPERFKGKQTNHQAKYVITPYALSLHMYGVSNTETEREASTLLSAYFSRYKGVQAFHETIARQFERGDHSFRNPFGRLRRVYAHVASGRGGGWKRPFYSPLVTRFHDGVKKATHFLGCSSGAELLNQKAIEIWEQLGLVPIMIIHDELIYELDKGEQGARLTKQICEIMTQPVAELGGMSIPIGLAIGNSYGTLKEVA